jgi:iron complex outermembrane receptor protein
MNWKSGLTACAGGAFLFGALGFAADRAVAQGSSGLEEVIVTARKRDESLLDVPISITALSAEQLETYNLQDMEEISRMTPGMFYTDFGGTGRQDRASSQFIVRGLSLNSFQSLSDAALLFIDGVPIISGNLPGSMDIERIEVLKGPQTAAFGRNTFSGAISVTTRDPAETFGGRATLEMANYDSSQVGLSLEGPLVKDRVFGRISVESRNEGAQYNNAVNGQPLGGQKTSSIWGSIKIVPSDNLEIKLVANYFEFNDDWGAQVRLVAADNNCDPGNTGSNTWFCGTVPQVTEADTSFFGIDQRWLDLSRPFFVVSPNNGEPGLVAENTHASAHISYTFANDWTLDSLTGFDKEVEGNIASEWYNPDFNHPFQGIPGRRQEQSWIYLLEGENQDFSQELRLSNAGSERLRWSVGANYVVFEQVGGLVGDVPLGAPLPLPGGYREATTTSAFGSVYYDLRPNLELGLEARYQKDKIKDIGLYWSANPLPPLEGDWTAFTPRVSLSYKPNDDMTIFGVYAQGNRPGAFNSSLQLGGGAFPDDCIAEIARQTGATLEADQEEIDTFDLGIKTRFAEGRGSATATVYAGTITNQQLTQSITLTSPCLVISSFITNQGEVDLQGVEFDVSYQLTDALTVSAAYSINDTEITKGDDLGNARFGASTNVLGNRLPRAPRNQGYAAINYAGQMRNGMGWYAGADYLFIGKKYVTSANLVSTGDQQLVNARIGIENDNLRIELWGKNIFDNDTPDAAFPSFDYDTFTSRAITQGLPRKAMFGVRMNYEF